MKSPAMPAYDRDSKAAVSIFVSLSSYYACALCCWGCAFARRHHTGASHTRRRVQA